MTEQSLPDRIQALIDTINQAIEQVENGELINLDDLDDEVQAVCEAAEEPDPNEMELVDERMDQMIAALEELSQAIDEFEHPEDEDEDEEE